MRDACAFRAGRSQTIPSTSFLATSCRKSSAELCLTADIISVKKNGWNNRNNKKQQHKKVWIPRKLRCTYDIPALKNTGYLHTRHDCLCVAKLNTGTCLFRELLTDAGSNRIRRYGFVNGNDYLKKKQYHNKERTIVTWTNKLHLGNNKQSYSFRSCQVLWFPPTAKKHGWK